MQTSSSIIEISKAMAEAQGEIGPALKDSTNPAFKSKYADIASVWEACRPVLKKHGLYAVQELTATNDNVSVVTRLFHKSGEWIECGPLAVPLLKKDAQGVGSACTYLRRYALCGMLGIVADVDDDGNAASSTNDNRHTALPKPKEHGEACGPLKMTELKDHMRAFLQDLEDCADDAQLLGLLHTSDALLDQCQRDLPGWWFTKPGSDVEGAADRIVRRRAELATK